MYLSSLSVSKIGTQQKIGESCFGSNFAYASCTSASIKYCPGRPEVILSIPKIPSGTVGPEYSGPGPLPKGLRIVSMSLWNCRFFAFSLRTFNTTYSWVSSNGRNGL